MKFKNLWQKMFKVEAGADRDLADPGAVESSTSLHNHAREWTSESLLELQRYYENWAARETWLIHDEGLCLLLGRDPADKALADDIEFQEQRFIFWQHLVHCVEQRMPPDIINRNAASEYWRAVPVELYRWAVMARAPIPRELADLLGFVSSAIGASRALDNETEQASNNWGSPDEHQSLERERVLSIMLSLSLQAQNKASGDNADAIREKMLTALYEKSRQYFNREEPPLSRPALHDLIDRSLETAGLIHGPH